MRRIVLIAHNVRSAHNVGSLFRTADGLGIERLILSGYTPYPRAEKDERMPHLAAKTDRQIAKTALGAEKTVSWEHVDKLASYLRTLAGAGYQIIALEQTASAQNLGDFKPGPKVALIVGNELTGLEPAVLAQTVGQVQIPMLGTKESFNVAAAAAMALYHLRGVGLEEKRVKGV